jgi:hypothetical protein
VQASCLRIVEPEVEEDDGAAEREAEKRAGQEAKEARDARRNKNKNSAQEWPNPSVRLVVAATACASFAAAARASFAAAACASLSPPVSRVVGSYLFFWGLRSFPPGDTAVPTILLVLILRLLASENKRRPIRLVTGPRSPRRRRGGNVGTWKAMRMCQRRMLRWVPTAVISHLFFSTKGDLRSTGAGQLPPRIVEPEGM